MIRHYLEPIIREVNGIMDGLHLTEVERKQIFSKDDQSDLSMAQLEAVANISIIFNKNGLEEDEMEYVCQECSKGVGE